MLVSCVIAVAIATVLGAIPYLYAGWNPYAAWLVAWNGATFAMFGLDKFQAVRGGGRVPEIVLYGLALIGGSLGGWAGMFAFRHKIRKVTFWIVLAVGTVVHVDLLFRVMQ
jgi:uncharacterized membrane protein YsdA (DUF1294 family)